MADERQIWLGGRVFGLPDTTETLRWHESVNGTTESILETRNERDRHYTIQEQSNNEEGGIGLIFTDGLALLQKRGANLKSSSIRYKPY